MDPESSHLHDFDELLRSLPACRRCRLNKRRCDTQLPSCHNCSKAGVECVFFDHILQEDRPRSYVFALLERLQRRQRQNGRPVNGSSHQGPRTSRYIGDLSCLSQALSVVNFTTTTLQGQHIPVPPALHVEGGLICTINQEIHDYLVNTYLTDIHCLYPFLDESLPFLSPGWRIDNGLAALDPQRRFILELVYSTAALHILDSVATDYQRQCYRILADECHRRGLALFDNVATDISIPALQTITLSVLHSLLGPKQGNLGQLIGLATRLAIDLNPGDRGEQTKMQQIYMSVYCIENQVATTLDRPGLLPAPLHMEHANPQTPQDIACALYRIQSRFRYHPNRQETVGSLSQQLTEYIDSLERQSVKPHPNMLAAAYETRLLLHPNCEKTAARLLEVYVHQHYFRTFLSPQWAYRAGVTVASESLQRDQQSQASSSRKWSGPACHAYGHCLVFLEQCSRRWPSCSALKESLHAFVSQSER